jgi:AcrR family transcriptional regulator
MSMSDQGVRADDGRVARRLENRVRIVDALFALIRHGNPHPTLKEIAAKAGVTSRTLLNHFPDVSALLLAAAARGRELADARLPQVDRGLPPADRVREFFRGAATFFEAYSAIRWATLTGPSDVAGIDQRRKGRVLGLIESRVAELFSGFGVALEQDRELRQVVWTVVDPLAWRMLRVQQGLSRAEAASSMARGVIALALAHDASARRLAPRPRASESARCRAAEPARTRASARG